MFRFARFEYLKPHMLIHSTPKTLKCKYCKLAFRQKRYLTQHTKLHVDFLCEVCHKQFPSERTLKVCVKMHLQ